MLCDSKQAAKVACCLLSQLIVLLDGQQQLFLVGQVHDCLSDVHLLSHEQAICTLLGIYVSRDLTWACDIWCI